MSAELAAGCSAVPGRGSSWGSGSAPLLERGAQHPHFNADVLILTTAKAFPAASRGVCRAPFQPILRQPERSPTDTNLPVKPWEVSNPPCVPDWDPEDPACAGGPGSLAGWNGVRPPPHICSCGCGNSTVNLAAWARETYLNVLEARSPRSQCRSLAPEGCEEVCPRPSPGPADGRPAFTRFSVCARLSRFPSS